VEDTDMSDWRKSTYSNGGGNACVETASGNGVVLVRDTTDRNGGTLVLSADAWQVFTSKTKNALRGDPIGGVARVGIAAHIARLRAVVGHELLLLPSVSVLPVDEAGRVLLVRHAGHDAGWGVLGGAVDVGEPPAAAAVREAREEIGVDVQLVRLLDVLGGPDYEVSYPNGDRVAYVTAFYEARVVGSSPVVTDGELSEVAWFEPGELPGLGLSRFARALLSATGRL
jgi:ADP-ribose pyrophosphatase YjhB (NUDIX family)